METIGKFCENCLKNHKALFDMEHPYEVQILANWIDPMTRKSLWGQNKPLKVLGGFFFFKSFQEMQGFKLKLKFVDT